MPITDLNLENWFTYHGPTEDQAGKYADIRNAGFAFARLVLRHTPSSADQTVAIRKIREAVMIANASIACGGK